MANENIIGKYKSILLEEYKIIQNKIDNIGGFKFKIRGWSITLQTALIVAIFTKELHYLLILILLLLLIPFIFYLLETEQEHQRKKLARRALDLEKLISDFTFYNDKQYEKKGREWTRSLMEIINGAPRIAFILRQNIKSKKIMRKKTKKKVFKDALKLTWKYLKKYRLYTFQYIIAISILILYSVGYISENPVKKEINSRPNWEISNSIESK